MNSLIRELGHLQDEPLRIEREIVDGAEVIVIEGVRYAADYFRTFAEPETDVLYGVRRGEDDVVRLTLVRNRVEAMIFFDETFGADPEFAWDDVKDKLGALLKAIEEEEQDDGL